MVHRQKSDFVIEKSNMKDRHPPPANPISSAIEFLTTEVNKENLFMYFESPSFPDWKL